MNVFRTFVAFCLIAVSVGCAANAPTNRCPELSILKDDTWKLGKAEFRAEQRGEEVYVTATGQFPTAGYQVRLVRDPAKIFPPRIRLYVKAPEAMAAQVISPFTVCASFRSRQPVTKLTINDATGAKQIEVRQP